MKTKTMTIKKAGKTDGFLPYQGSLQWALSYLGVTCKQWKRASEAQRREVREVLRSVFGALRRGSKLTALVFMIAVVMNTTGWAQTVTLGQTTATMGGTAADTAASTPSKDKVVVENPPSWFSEAESLAGTIFAAKQVSLAIYPSYDPYITVGGVKKPFGFGAALLYPVSDYAFAGVRLDFLGNTFWAPSAVVGAKYTLKNMPLTPTVFTVAGLIMPLGGAGNQNHDVSAVTGIGATCVLYSSKDSQGRPDGRFSLNAFIEGEKWTPKFDGVILHPGIAGAIKF